jgi:hypothetical protein
VAHGAGLDVLKDGGEVFQNEVVLCPCALFRNFVKQLGRFQEITEPGDGFFGDGGEQFPPAFAVLVDAFVDVAIVLQDLIGEEVHPLREVFVENEA